MSFVILYYNLLWHIRRGLVVKIQGKLQRSTKHFLEMEKKCLKVFSKDWKNASPCDINIAHVNNDLLFFFFGKQNLFFCLFILSYSA